MQLVNGEKYEGVFSSIDTDHLTLRVCKLVANIAGDPIRTARPVEMKTFETSEWTRIDAVDVRMSFADVGTLSPADDVGGFRTDAAISRGRGGAQGRELQRWTPDEGDAGHFMHLEESTCHTARGWDQFALNESKFGVKTDYKEELYTTALDPSNSKISVAEAERIAAEIEKGDKSNITNIHVLEERGIVVDDGDIDEEARYGAVIREEKGKEALEEPVALRSSSDSSSRVNAWLRESQAVSAPIPIGNARREANKLVAHITGTGSVGKATSPYGTPKNKASLTSPLVSDVQNLEALNLNPASARFDDETMRQFQEFKAKQGRNLGGPTLSEMKQFSESLQSKLQRKASLSSIKADSSVSGAAAEDNKPTGLDSAKESSSATEIKSSSDQSMSDKAKKSTLNPNAKSFSFNVAAKEFNPGFATTSSMKPGSRHSTGMAVGSRSDTIPERRASHRVPDSNDGPSFGSSNLHGGYHSMRRYDSDRHDRRRDESRSYDRKGGANNHSGSGSGGPYVHGRSSSNMGSNRMNASIHHVGGMMGNPPLAHMVHMPPRGPVTVMMPTGRPAYGVVPTYTVGGIPTAAIPGGVSLPPYAMPPSGIPVSMPSYGSMSGPGYKGQNGSPGSNGP